MSECIKEVRATLEQVRDHILGAQRDTPIELRLSYVNDALERLANAIDVLTGEVERLDAQRNPNEPRVSRFDGSL